jgi:integrase
MATITKRGKSYLISTSCGYDSAGKQIRKSMTVRQEKKAVKAAAVRFEDRVQSGQYIDPTITFKEFSEKWVKDYAEPQLEVDTVASYKVLLPRINAAIGHIKLSKLQPHHIIEFYNNLSEPGMRRDGSYTAKFDMTTLLREKGMLKKDLAKSAGISDTTLLQVSRGKSVAYKTAKALCKVLDLQLDKGFTETGKSKLSGNTILHYHNLIKSILSTAVKWQVIPSSPADRVAAPKREHIEQKCLDEEQTQEFILALQDAPINRRTAALLLLCSGMRRSELYGLTWDDINIEKCLVSIHRATVFVPHTGIIDKSTKTSGSTRVIKLPECCRDILLQYRAWLAEQQLQCGDLWQSSNRLFVTWNGHPESPNAFTNWFRKFARQHNMPEDIHVHSLRHTNATLQITAHQDVRTVSARLGHSQTSTTLNIYAHAIQSADATAAEVLNNILVPKKQTINNK